MFDPLLTVSLPPGLSRVSAVHQSGNLDAEKVIVLQQVYDDVAVQDALLQLAKGYVDRAGVRLVAVEGADQPVAPPRRGATLADWMTDSTNEVSAAVLGLLAAYGQAVEVIGVDDTRLVASSRQESEQVGLSRQRVNQAAAGLRRLLTDARRRYYMAPLARFRDAVIMMDVSEERMSVSSQVDLIRQAAKMVDLDLHDYTMLSALEEVQRRSKHQNSGQIKRQQLTLMDRLLRRLDDWVKVVGPNEVSVDMKKAEPMLAYWIERAGLSGEEFSAMLDSPGPEFMFRQMKRWFEEWLTGSLLEQRDQHETLSFELIEELMRLALRLGVPYFDLHELRNYSVCLRMSDVLTGNGLASLNSLQDELAMCARQLAERCDTHFAPRLFEIEQQLHGHYLALRLQLSPHQAALAGFASGKLSALLNELCDLLELPVPVPLSSTLGELDPVVTAARSFDRHSGQRARHMAFRTLDLMREHGEDRALLVAGGFHTEAIVNVFEDQRSVSWCVVTPRLDSAAYVERLRRASARG